MRAVQPAPLPLLLCLALLGLGGLASGCTTGSTENRDLSTSRQGLRRVDELVDSGNRQQAVSAFAEIHEPMHATASKLAPVDSNGAEVVNDITEVLDRNLTDPNTELTTLSELSHKAIQFLDEARYLLG